MPYSRKNLVLLKIQEIAKDKNRPLPSSRGSVAIGGPQEALEEALGPADEEDLHVVTSALLKEGSAADVWLYQVKKTSSLLAGCAPEDLPDVVPVVKKVMRVAPRYFRNFGSCRDFQERFQLWKSLAHPSIAALYFIAPRELTLFQEYCENGNLREYLKQSLSEIEHIRIVEDILRGVVYLHGRDPPVAHGYINPGKIYIGHAGRAKLGEFGLSKSVAGFSHLVPSITVTGMTRWMSPEYFNDSEPGLDTIPGDIWSFGCTLLEMITGLIPYHKSRYDTQVLAKILGGVHPGNPELERYPKGREYPQEYIGLVRRLISQCWLPIAKRPSSQDLLEQVTQVLFRLHQAPSEALKFTYKPLPISATMSIDEIFSCLTHYCCTDMTPLLDFSSVDDYPVRNGGHNDIYHGRLLDGTEVALKVGRNLPGAAELNPVLRVAHELYVWSKCNHPNILPFIGAAMFHNSIALITPWMKQDDLSAWRQRTLSTEIYLDICAQISDGLSYLHSVGIVHGNLKGRKVLMSDDMIPKIIGFSQAVFLNPYNALQFDRELGRKLTIRWAAPEKLRWEEDESSRGTVESDVYSLGMTILEVITGDVPWPGRRDFHIIKSLMEGERPKRPHFDLPDEQADLVWDLLTQCWEGKPADRPTAAGVRDKLKAIIDKKPTIRSSKNIVG
ncbi:unnamed protein product [Rhizoctonia solani]|nr:unnamed protein product [Rhizoctonia solani]